MSPNIINIRQTQNEQDTDIQVYDVLSEFVFTFIMPFGGV